MADRQGIELARVGQWDLSTGPLTVTPQMLTDAATRAGAAGDKFRAPLKLGHVDPRFDGEPAMGWLHGLRVEGEGDDAVLKGDVTGMPDWLATLEPTAYPDRSIEGLVHNDGAGFEVTGLALLGVTPPGMSTIRSLRDLPAALGVTDQPLPVAASFKAANDTPSTNPVAASDPQTPAEPVQPPTHERTDTMSDLNKGLRERLGIADDAELDDAGILAAVDQALTERAEPVAAAAAAEPTVPAGSVVINASALEELKIAAAAGMEARKVQLIGDRDTTIGQAIKAGQISPARRDHWITQWDQDPEGIKAAIGELPTVFPVVSVGHLGSDGTAGELTVDTNDESVQAFAAALGINKEALTA